MRLQRPRTARERKVWLSTGGTLVGLGLLAGATTWQAIRHNTDLADPTTGLSAFDRESLAVDKPVIRFVDVTSVAGIDMIHGPGARGRSLPEDTGSGIAWGDFDGDGDFDLYVVNFPGQWEGVADGSGSNRLFRNDGGTFVDVTESAGVGDPDGFGMGAYFVDFDDDGHVDLYVTNVGPNRLFRNQGDGTFRDVAAEAGVDDPSWSTGAAWGDVNQDGYIDLYVANYLHYDTAGIGPGNLSEAKGGEAAIPFTLNPNSFDPVPNRLYLNRGDGTFVDVAQELGVDDPSGRSLSVTICDLDGDGWLDIYVNNDVSTNRLFRNRTAETPDQSLRFHDFSTVTGVADPRGSMGLSVADVGRASGQVQEPDGLPDLFITHWTAQENAFFMSLSGQAGQFEFRDRIRDLRLAEISTDVVGWGSAFLDLDLDGVLDLVVVNGSTLEQPDDILHLQPEPLHILWNDGQRFHLLDSEDLAAATSPMVGRGLAIADYDGDGDVDLAVAVNRGAPRLLRNDSPATGHSLTIVLDAPAASSFGARVTVTPSGGSPQVRWWGADVGYLGSHAAEMVFGLADATSAESINVRWIGGTETNMTNVPSGRVSVRRVEP